MNRKDLDTLYGNVFSDYDNKQVGGKDKTISHKSNTYSPQSDNKETDKGVSKLLKENRLLRKELEITKDKLNKTTLLLKREQAKKR